MLQPESRHLFANRGLANRVKSAKSGGALLERPRETVIIGLGVDIEQVNRIEEAITRHGEAFLRRIYSQGEISYCERHKNKFERYAARFAVKEATMKALGTGWSRGVRWRDIEVVNLPTGKPILKLAGATKEISDRMGVKHISISISHGINFAIAQVIFEGDAP